MLNKPYPNKTPGQSLPRTLRRRNMSHNRYRIPSRIRNKQPLQTSKIYKRAYCRKHIRKSAVLSGLYRSREKQGYWLETHLYQTKRAHMDNYFGFKIPIKYNEKNLRSAYRFCQNDAIIHDSSYYSIITLQGDRIQSLLKNYFQDQEIFKDKYKDGKLWQNQQFFINNKLESIVQCIWKNISTLIMIVHPASIQIIYDLLASNNDQVLVEKIVNRINIFQFKGPKSVLYLYKLFQYLEVQNDLNSFFKLIHDPNCYPKNSAYFGSCPYQKKQKTQQFPKGIDRSIQDQKSFLDEQNKLQQAYLNLYQFKQKIDHNQIWKDILTEKKDFQLEKFKNIQRARFSHKKVAPKQSIKQEVDIKLQDILQKEQEQQVYKSILDFVILFERDTLGGCKLILKQGDSNFIWRLLNYVNTKAVGLSEMNHSIHESESLIFPDDYPHTRAYLIQQQNLVKFLLKENKLKIKWNSKPPAKRLNYEKIKSPFPFFSPLYEQQNLFTVKITMLGRGIPSNLGYICLAQQIDLQNIREKNCFDVICTENVFDLEEKSKQSQDRTLREIIGFITTGGYSYKKNKGFAIGSLFKYNQLFQESGIVLIRKNTSRYYFAALCELYHF